MANKVLLKKSSVAARVPLVGDLDYGELALNYTDGKLYYKTATNTIKSFTDDTSVVTLTGTQTLTNKTLTSPTITSPTLSGGTINNTVIGGSTPAAITGSSVTSTGNLVSSYSSGDEGGEILLTKAQTNTTIAGAGVRIDVYQNKLRFWEDGGTNRGVYIDLTAAGTGVGSNLLASGGGTTTNALTIGTGLSGTSFNGSSAVTIAIDSTVATLTGSQTLTNKTLSSATLTGTLTASSSAGTSGQVLSSTGSGVQWINPPWPTATYTALAEFGSTGITTETSVHSFAIATYRTAKYIIQVTNGTAYNSLEVLVSHNGTNVWIATNSNSYATNDPSAGSYFDGNYINLALREGDIQIGTINAGIRFYISGVNLIFAATAISGTISVKGQVTLIKV